MPAFCKELPYYAKMCIKFWKYWCDKHSIEFIICNEYPLNPETTPCTVQKLFSYEILDGNNIQYDQCCLVDWDTFPMPNAKNIFEYTNNKFSVCLDYGYPINILRSIEFMQQFFENTNVTWDNYFNSGLFVFNKNHKYLFKEAREICLKYDNIRKKNEELFHGDQTVLNYIVHKYELVNILPRSFMVHEHFLKIFLNNYVDHHNKFIDAQSYMNNINFVHITDNEDFRNNLVNLIYEKFYKNIIN